MNELKRQRIEKELLAIERSDGLILTPKVVERAKRKTSAMHSEFQWDDSRAAHEHRLWQARRLVSVVLIGRGPERERTFTSVRVLEKVNGHAPELVRAYVRLEKVWDDPELRQQVLDIAIGELQHWAGKYRHFPELKDVIRAIDKFSKQRESFASAA